MRESYFHIYKTTSYNINWTTIRRALPCLELNAFGDVIIRDKKWYEKLAVYYNNIVAIGLALSAVGTISITIMSSGLGFRDIVKLTLLVFSIAVNEVFSFAQNFPDFASKKIVNEITIVPEPPVEDETYQVG